MKTTASLVKLIAFAVVTLLAFGVLAATIANVQLGAKTRYTAIFTDATGLQKGDDVRIAGVRVGEVKSIGLVTRGRPVRGQGRLRGPEVLDPDPGHRRSDPLPQPDRSAVRRPDRGHRLDRRHAGRSDHPGQPDPAGPGPRRPLQRVQAAVRRAVAERRQRAVRRDHPGAAGRGRQHRPAAGPHGFADLDPRRPRPGDRADDHQPQRRARHGPATRQPARATWSTSSTGSSPVWPRTAPSSATP